MNFLSIDKKNGETMLSSWSMYYMLYDDNVGSTLALTNMTNKFGSYWSLGSTLLYVFFHKWI